MDVKLGGNPGHREQAGCVRPRLIQGLEAEYSFGEGVDQFGHLWVDKVPGVHVSLPWP
jgi:hypothetical protein